MENLIEAHEITLAELLRKGKFSVPRHQRYYDWEARQVEELLEDMYDSFTQNRPSYFLGSIMLVAPSKSRPMEINDGQQRIVTFSMICAYFCRMFKEQGNSRGEGDCMRILFQLPEVHTKSLDDADTLPPRVSPPRNDAVNFKKLICGHDIQRNGKMTSAWNTICSFFDRLKDFPLTQQRKMLEFMLNKVVVVQLKVDKSLDVNAIYETLNARGKNLSDVDLLKNYFLWFFADDSSEDRGDTVEIQFENIQELLRTHASEYIRCYMQIKHSFINKEKFYRETKRIFGSPKGQNADQVFGLMRQIADKSNLQAFKVLLRKTESREFTERLTSDAGRKQNIDFYLLDLQEYTIARPILFALFLRYLASSANNKKRDAVLVYICTKLLASFVQRTAHVGLFKPSLLEKQFAELANDIHEGVCVTANAFFARLQGIDRLGIINNSQYIELMVSKLSGRNSIRRSRHILRKIADLQQSGLSVSEDDITVEHILPDSREHYENGDWSNAFNPDERDRLVHSLGNLTLLVTSQNSPTAKDNASFEAKKEIFRGSSFKLTQDIYGYTEWTPRQVKSRHQKLAGIAAKRIWNFDL